MDSEKPAEMFEKYRGELSIASGIFIAYIILHVIFQRHELMAYDMYTYTSFAQHYAENWFYTVIPGQAHGLQIVSYPPLLFQLMALVSYLPIPMEWIAILFMSGAVTAFSFSFSSFARTLIGLERKGYMILTVLVAFSPAVLKFSLVHGQLSFLAGMIFAFLSAGLFQRILEGEDLGAYLTVSLTLTAYIHHFSLLMAAVLLLLLGLFNFRDTVRRLSYIIPPILVSGSIAFIGLYPVIRETLFGISQGVIFHGSRNPLETWKIFHQFITSTYGITSLGILLVLKRSERLHRVNMLALVFLTIGLGLITPTAEMLFGPLSTFLVYDRFSLIASLFLTAVIGYYIAGYSWSLRGIDLSKLAIVLFLAVSLVTVFWANDLHLASPTGYGDYDPERSQIAADYLNNNASEDYLYLTFDHHPPVAELRTNTDVPTLETGYFQGRNHGILPDYGKFDRVKTEQLSEIVSKADRVSLKYIFTFYEKRAVPAFRDTDWQRERLGEGVTVWINPDAERYEPDLGERRFLFGTVPFMALIFCISIVTVRPARERLEGALKFLRSWIEAFSGRETSKSWLLVAIFPLVAAAPSFLTSGYPAGIDTPAHIFKPQLIGQMIQQHGEVFRWTTEWYSGYPFMAMYPPVTTFAFYYLDSVLGNITAAFNAVRFVALASLSGVFYLLTGNITGDKRLRLLGSAMVVFSYPLYSNLYTVGRVASAVALPLYFFLIHLLLRDDVFQKDISRGHLYIGLSAGSLFLIHSMMAYLFVFTGLIFCWVYREDVRRIGFRPVLLTFGLPLILAAPYIIRLVQHFSVTDPYWYVEPSPFAVFDHLERFFDATSPNYSGWLPVAFFSIAVARLRGSSDRFFTFSMLNFVFFYIAFWARNFGVAYMIPLSQQFDLARFEIIFTVFGLLIAVYGARYVFEQYLSGIEQKKKSLLSLVLVLFLCFEFSPMLTQSANWEPEFGDELEEIELKEGYRAVGLDIRKWHTYILWELDVENTFGWFGQANPNQFFTQSLKRAGGRWYGEPLEYSREDEYRKNLMELSNTRYIVSADGQWMNPLLKTQVKGADTLNHQLNDDLVDSIERDREFELNYSSEHLSIYELERPMSYCEPVRPEWITRDYRHRATQMLLQEDMLPRLPVEAKDPGIDGNATGVECSSTDPYTRTIEVEEEGWVLVKESYYPFWEKTGEGKIYDAFGFMMVYVEDEAKLKYRPRNLSTLSPSDFMDLVR